MRREPVSEYPDKQPCLLSAVDPQALQVENGNTAVLDLEQSFLFQHLQGLVGTHQYQAYGRYSTSKMNRSFLSFSCINKKNRLKPMLLSSSRPDHPYGTHMRRPGTTLHHFCLYACHLLGRRGLDP